MRNVNTYAKFVELDLNDNQVEALATDSQFQLDGRKSIYNLRVDAFKRIHQLRNVQKGYMGFNIYKNGKLIDSYVFHCREAMENSSHYKRYLSL